MKILISIKSPYVQRILSKEKKYEFRRTMCKRPIEAMVIYETMPTGKVVAEATVTNVLCAAPAELWEIVKEAAGMDKTAFFAYYFGCKNAVAYELGEVTVFSPPLQLSEIGVKRPPQSYVYLPK